MADGVQPTEADMAEAQRVVDAAFEEAMTLRVDDREPPYIDFTVEGERVLRDHFAREIARTREARRQVDAAAELFKAIRVAAGEPEPIDVGHLPSRVAVLARELSEAWAEVERLRNDNIEVERLSTHAAALEAEVERLRGELTTLQSSHASDRCMEALAKLVRDNATLEAQVARLRGE